MNDFDEIKFNKRYEKEWKGTKMIFLPSIEVFLHLVFNDGKYST